MELLFIFLLAASVIALLMLIRSTRKMANQMQANVERLIAEKKVVLDFLHDLGESLTEEGDRRQLLDTILQCSINVTSASSGVIYMANTQKAQLIAESINGLFPPPVSLPPELENKVTSRSEYLETILRSEPINLNDSSQNILANICRTGQPAWLPDAATDPRIPNHTSESLQCRSLIAVPLKFQGEILGVLALAKAKHLPPFNLSDFEISKSIATQASFSLHNANVFNQLAEKERLDRDLETAREVQRIMLPKACPEIPGYQIAAFNRPAQRVSGDYYDFLPIDDDHLGIVIADVSGKGVPASLIMAMCRTVMRTEAAGCHSAAEVLRKANRILFNDIREDMFITLAYLVLNSKTHTITVAKAGHDAPLLCTDSHTRVETIQAPGMALGIDSGEVFDNVLEDFVLPLKPNDTVLVYTDGINEAIDAQGQEFGRDQIKSAMLSSATSGVEAMVKNLVERVSRFTGGIAQNDDMTLVAIQRK